MAYGLKGFVSIGPSEGIHRSDAEAARAVDRFAANRVALTQVPDWNTHLLELWSLRCETRLWGTPATGAAKLDMPSTECIAVLMAQQGSLERRVLMPKSLYRVFLSLRVTFAFMQVLLIDHFGFKTKAGVDRRMGHV